MRWVLPALTVLCWCAPAARADEAPPPPAGPVVFAAPGAPAGEPARRGPIEVREEWTLAAPRLTLPATSPDPLRCGEVRVHVGVNRGNDFGYAEVTSDRTVVRHWMVDAEHQTTEVGVRWGLKPDLDVGVRVPLRWRGPGFMDDPIDQFHDFTGLQDNGRPDFSVDTYDVRVRREDGVLVGWDETGTGLGNVELEVHWAFLRRRATRDWSAALVGRVGLPTATAPYDTGSVDLGLQLVAAKEILCRLDVYLGVGGTFFSQTEHDGLEYEPLRGHAFGVLEWRVGRAWSLFLELSGATQLLADVPAYPWSHAYVHAGLKVDLARCWTLEVGFTEGLVHQQATVDFGAFAGLTARF